MADKRAQIVIKKITVVSGGAHGGAWKVAFADFMTAMMAFFLVMWLLATSSEAEKKAISDYFSTPSVIEYQFSNFGVELTLEKLFLDLVNEPLKTLSGFISPMDATPNLMGMGMKKVVMAYMAEQLGDVAKNVQVSSDTVVFDIPESALFEKGTASPAGQFVAVMEKVKGVTGGLEDTDIVVTSAVYTHSVPDQDPKTAKNLAEERLDLIQAKVKSSLENPTVDITGKAQVRSERGGGTRSGKPAAGYIRLELKQKQKLSDGNKPRKFVDSVFGESEEQSVYNNFVDKVSKQKKKRDPQSVRRRDNQ